ncbi:sugar isomerase domain-containing protein [Halalkalibacter hemicellulosilyticus]|uniref:SIS domain-containing protein n=1 Tax=Halalkalibacter hemicellulosilyticusJCM 9152 TaxID=1236971 RepID=W4QMH0_9BACI|nr:SIS domain-containing protein [Halalkalibacter hemicellulosilyticus]GAE32843.1 hypothetical protein JCM9152_4430 [Halalkalibacter hemicellulosilyticusJCM 9152]
MISQYLSKIQHGLKIIEKTELKQIEKAALQVSHTIKNNGLLHIFGCGHSHLIAEECFYRAGGLVQINPILDEALMLHKSAIQAATLERDPNYGHKLLEEQRLTAQDTLLVVSTSGRNAVPIDVALYGIEKEIPIIIITSLAYQSFPSRHHSRKHLSELGGIVINNHVPIGDAIMTHEHIPVPFTPVSTLHSIAITNAIMTKAIEYLADIQHDVPIFLSGNIENSQDYNHNLLEKYKHNIPMLSK